MVFNSSWRRECMGTAAVERERREKGVYLRRELGLLGLDPGLDLLEGLLDGLLVGRQLFLLLLLTFLIFLFLLGLRDRLSLLDRLEPPLEFLLLFLQLLDKVFELFHLLVVLLGHTTLMVAQDGHLL